jgi:hypothetical protein
MRQWKHNLVNMEIVKDSGMSGLKSIIGWWNEKTSMLGWLQMDRLCNLTCIIFYYLNEELGIFPFRRFIHKFPNFLQWM